MSHLSESKAAEAPREGTPWLARGPLLGMACILAATACFATMSAIIRGISGQVPPVEVAFFRSLFGLVMQLPFVMWWGVGALRTSRLRLHLTRGTVHAVSMMLFFVGLTMVPLAEVTSLEFAAPIMSTTFAILFLGEVVRTRRLVALGIGIAGLFFVHP